MSVFKKCFIVFVVVLGTTKVWGQAARSPFTTYGVGEPYGNSLAHNQGMGGLGVAQPQYWFVNNQNPALLVYNTLTIFGAGIVGERRTIRGDSTSEQSTNGNMNYLVTAFPIKINKWTTSIGLMPFTNVNYSMAYTDFERNPQGVVTDTVVVEERGTGGLTELFWSNGVRLTQDIAVGVKASYIFGPIENIYSNQPLNPNQPIPYIINIEERTRVSDFNVGLGFSYSKDSIGAKNNYRLSIGGTYTFGNNMNARRVDQITRQTLGGSTVEGDTLTTRQGKVFIPPSLSGGVSFAKDGRWAVGTEYSYQDWSSFKSINAEDEGLGKSWRYAFGGEITPDAFSPENLLKRMTYRVGLSFEQYPFLANNNVVKDFGINFGLSVPTGRSSFDLAFKVGQRGNRGENILEENYFKVYFGLTFNDQWFIKRKFD